MELLSLLMENKENAFSENLLNWKWQEYIIYCISQGQAKAFT